MLFFYFWWFLLFDNLIFLISVSLFNPTSKSNTIIVTTKWFNNIRIARTIKQINLQLVILLLVIRSSIIINRNSTNLIRVGWLAHIYIVKCPDWTQVIIVIVVVHCRLVVGAKFALHSVHVVEFHCCFRLTIVCFSCYNLRVQI